MDVSQISSLIPLTPGVQDGLTVNGITAITTTAGIVIWNNRKVLTNFFDKLLQKGLHPEVLIHRVSQDDEYSRLFTKIIQSISRELLEEKLDVWTELTFKIYTGQDIDAELDFDHYIKWLEELTPFEISVLTHVYRNSMEQETYIPLSDLRTRIGYDSLHEALCPSNEIAVLQKMEEKLAFSLQRLNAMGLISTHQNKTVNRTEGGMGVLSKSHYILNNYGARFSFDLLKVKETFSKA